MRSFQALDHKYQRWATDKFSIFARQYSLSAAIKKEGNMGIFLCFSNPELSQF